MGKKKIRPKISNDEKYKRIKKEVWGKMRKENGGK